MGESTRAHGTGFQRIDSEAACLITRFELRSAIYMPLFLIAYRRVVRQAVERAPGLLKSSFMIESPRACCHLSLWKNERAINQFNAECLSHFQAVRWSVKLIRKHARDSYGIFSIHCRLHALSNNLTWDGTDGRAWFQTTTVPS